MPAGTVDATVDDEWSLAQTLRHLVMATDTWLGKAILEREQPYHPAGLPNDDHDTEAYDESAFSAEVPSFEQVLQTRAGRQAMVPDFLADPISRRRGGTRTLRTARRPCSRACARSSRRSGSTIGMPCVTSTYSLHAFTDATLFAAGPDASAWEAVGEESAPAAHAGSSRLLEGPRAV